jgi:ATP-dependent protease ClpP protease subunit
MADAREILIYDEIVPQGSPFGVSAMDVREQLPPEGEPFTLRLNSPGGEVFAGKAIFELLKARKADLTVHIDALAGSIASILPMAADPKRVHMAEGAFMMVHKPWTVTIGNEEVHDKQKAILAKVGEELLKHYASRATVDESTLRDWMEAETWLTADEAQEAGLVGNVTPINKPVAANCTTAQFNNAPDKLAPNPAYVATVKARDAVRFNKRDTIDNYLAVLAKHRNEFYGNRLRLIQMDTQRVKFEQMAAIHERTFGKPVNLTHKQ